MPVRLHVHTDGPATGRPVVLIHGWPLSGRAWEAQMPALAAAGYRAVAYDRRGFGQSEKPAEGFDYDTLAQDLDGLLAAEGLTDVTLVGFSMGGGEVARYVSNHGQDRLHSVVFAAAVPPCLMQGPGNPEGPLKQAVAEKMEGDLRADRAAFFDAFTTEFFSANGRLCVTEEERQKAIALCHQSDQAAALGCMKSFGTTDFRPDLARVTVPTLVLHGDADAIVPLEGSGLRTHRAIAGSWLEVIAGGPHGCNASHAEEFNRLLIGFLGRAGRI